MIKLTTLQLKLAEDYWNGQTFYSTAASRFSFWIVIVGLALALGTDSLRSLRRSVCSFIPHFAL